MRIKKNGKTINLTEADIKKLKNFLLKEEDKSSGSISMTPTTNCIDSKTTPKIKRIFNKLTNLGYKCHGVSGRSIGVKKTISCPDGIEQEIHIDITEKEGFWDPKPGDLNYTLVSDGKVVSGYEYNPIKLQKVKSLENTIKSEYCIDTDVDFSDPKHIPESVIKIKKDGDTFNLTESDIKKLSKSLLKEETKKGKGCAESEGGSGCIKKGKYVDKDGTEYPWHILNNKKGGVFKGCTSKKDCEDILSVPAVHQG